MDLIQGLLLITSIHLLAAASPGPDFVLVSQQTLINGRRAGLMCSLGISLGLSVHILYSAFGLAAVIASSISALWAIKIFGGSYLIYLGIKGIRSKSSNNSEQNNNVNISKSSLKIVAVGFLCNVLNPKAPIYFISLFTIVLSPDMPLYHIAIYGLWMMCIQFIWFSLVAILLSKPVINRKFKRFSHWIDRVLGVAMIGLGLKIIATRTN
jgi:threonine efflux protein